MHGSTRITTCVCSLSLSATIAAKRDMGFARRRSGEPTSMAQPALVYQGNSRGGGAGLQISLSLPVWQCEVFHGTILYTIHATVA